MGLFILFLHLAFVTPLMAAFTTTVFFDDECNKTFIVDPAVRIFTALEGYVRANQFCNVFLTANSRQSNELGIIRSVNIPCSYGHVDIYDGRSLRDVSDQNKLVTGICGTDAKQWTAFNSTKNGLVLQLITKQYNFDGKIDILVTSYFDGQCSSREYKCANGWCIYTGLRCDGLDNCGDNSDEINCGSSRGSNPPSLSIQLNTFVVLLGVYIFKFVYKWI